jgi:hypothetical protein
MRILSLLIFITGLFFSNQKTDSPHGAGFKISCKTCHNTSGWQLDLKVYSFNHNKTKMPLTGEHKVVTCKLCHPTLKFNEAKTNCNECHTDIHQGTTGGDCSRCHTPSSWLVNNIIEVHQLSRFPLNNAHRTVDCSLCHKLESIERFDVVGVNCIDCHRKDYLATTNPNHIQSGISEECTLCHPANSTQWATAGFDHNVFPLTLGHTALKCADCHSTGSFKGVNRECFTCHQSDFLATKSPNHSLALISTSCTDCHTVAPGWKPVTFNHNSFPLTLGHSGPVCIDCHKGGNYTTISPLCYSCHQNDFTATTNPNHISAGFSTVCTNCHTVNPGWKPTIINHSGFPLTLVHSTPACADCHKGGVYSATPVDCYSCHQADYTATINPNHNTLGTSKICQTCHTLTPGWKPATFNHAAFPLTLGHAGPLCNDCHKGNYATTSTNCYTCHQVDYTASTNPNHVTSGIPATCTTCHTTAPGWKTATFSHTTFPLTLGHATATCNDCHKGNYTTTSTVCYSCHLTDYNNSTNPNHKTLAFATTCNTCHTTIPGWKPATYTQHDAQMFPIYSGRHLGRWTLCTDCHTNTANYALYQCLTCHPKATMDSAHSGRNGYSYVSTVCYSCHPRGTT